ncbi:hypothetical protein HDU93_007204 [Gonapodya sp. JEL0774]|nr:hypothetical protein HDU93_007204 [Gonapodya sp. JEL0774]
MLAPTDTREYSETDSQQIGTDLEEDSSAALLRLYTLLRPALLFPATPNSSIPSILASVFPPSTEVPARLLFASSGVSTSTLADIDAYLRSVSRTTFGVEDKGKVGRVHLAAAVESEDGSIVGPSLIEECVVQLMHDGEVPWLMPGVKPTGKRVSIPLVISVTSIYPPGLSTPRINSITVYWDQATVLRQMRVLPETMFCKANNSEMILPVQGVQQADRVKEALSGNDSWSIVVLGSLKLGRYSVVGTDPASLAIPLHNNQRSAPTEITAHQRALQQSSSNIFKSDVPVPVHHSSLRVDPSRPGHTSQIDLTGGGAPHLEPRTPPPKRRQDPRRYEQHFSVGEQAGSAPVVAPIAPPPVAPSSSAPVIETTPPASPPKPTVTPTAVVPPAEPEVRHGRKMPPPASAAISEKKWVPGRKMMSNGGGNVSQWGTDWETGTGKAGEQAAALGRKRGGEGGRPRGNESQWGFGDSLEAEKIRPSSRVLAPPGGGSNVQLG